MMGHLLLGMDGWMDMDTLPARLLPPAGKWGSGSADEGVMDRAGGSSRHRGFTPRGSGWPHAVPSPRLFPAQILLFHQPAP